MQSPGLSSTRRERAPYNSLLKLNSSTADTSDLKYYHLLQLLGGFQVCLVEIMPTHALVYFSTLLEKGTGLQL